METDYIVYSGQSLFTSGGTGREFEGTVENLASCLIIHEWFSHGILYEGDHKKNHVNSYKRQKADKIFFPKTTNKFKSFVEKGINKYKRKEK